MRCWILILQWLLMELVTSEASMLGTHFLLQFPFMPEGRPLLMAYSLQPKEVTVTVSAPRLPGFKVTELLVTNLAVETYAVPRVIMMGHATRGSALQAKSSAKFGVTVYLPVSRTSGAAFPAIPVTRFGNAYTLLFTTVRPYLCFLASTDLTSVELQADRNVPDLRALLPTGQADILLQKGEARTILNCKYVDDVISSIAVMRVKSNRAIGVITGNCEIMPQLKVCQVVGRKVAERISGDMILSDNSAGKHFLIPMLDKHVCCVYFLSLSGKVTTLNIQTNPAVTSLSIPARRYVNLTAEQVLGKWINASLPVVCYLEFTSTYHGVHERYGLSMIVPVELFTSMYVWSTVTIKHQELHHYFAVVSPRDNFFLNVDGVVPKLSWTSVEGARWQAATQKVTPGTHTAYAVNPANFGLYVYGVSATVMFPHYAGFVFTNLYGPCQKTRPQLNDKVDNDCDGFVDEENVDSKDNDGDGLVDEDNAQVPSTFKSLKQGPATYKMEIVFPKSYPDDCPCPNPANCNIELCRGRVNYIRCLEDLVSHPTCKTGSYMEAKQKLATVSKVYISRVCTGKCPSSLRDCYPIKDMTSDMKSDLSCDQVINLLTCFDLFVNNPACSAMVRNEATPQASEVTTLGQTNQCEVDSCKEARTLCLKETNKISCEKLKERHKCALGYKDTPYCSEGVRKDAEEWIENHAIKDCAAEVASLSELEASMLGTHFLLDGIFLLISFICFCLGKRFLAILVFGLLLIEGCNCALCDAEKSPLETKINDLNSDLAYCKGNLTSMYTFEPKSFQICLFVATVMFAGMFFAILYLWGEVKESWADARALKREKGSKTRELNDLKKK